MKEFEPVKRLEVFRRLSAGHRVRVGELAQNKQAVFFQYDADYLQRHPSLSPFLPPFNNALQQAPSNPHNGLHGVFADSLPDGWGMLLMDRIFRQHGILAHQVTAMDRLAYIGSRGMGALEYAPISSYAAKPGSDAELAVLGEQARALFDSDNAEVPPALADAGRSGGARPKAQVYLPADGRGRAGLNRTMKPLPKTRKRPGVPAAPLPLPAQNAYMPQPCQACAFIEAMVEGCGGNG